MNAQTPQPRRRRGKARNPSFANLLERHAQEDAERPALVTLGSDGREETRLSYGELHTQVERLAAALAARALGGERVLMLFEPGAAFVAAFLACLRAGAVALPANLAKPGRSSWARLVAVVRDADPKMILTERASIPKIASWIATSPLLSSLDLVALEDLEGTSHPLPVTEPRPDAAAFLQYTSGSTGDPKGTVVTFGNLAANAELTGPAFSIDRDARVVCWLPPYHDLGLIGNILQVLYAGALCVLLPPVSFVQNPKRWLELIDRYDASVSMAPNFAYELCVRRTQPEDRAALDLSRWRAAINAAEPIRASTLARFSEAFRDCGFRPEAFRCAYGLAEATLVVAAGEPRRVPRVVTADAAALDDGRIVQEAEADRSVAMVSSGRVRPPQRVRIVDPETGAPRADGLVGEIWVGGPCVAAGYWGRAEETRAVFEAFTDGGEGPFLRTGDLGAMMGGELFVTGRIKEVIIVHGRKIYPQDVEASIQGAHEALRPGGGAAFAVEGAEGEALVVVQEVERSWLGRIDYDSVRTAAAQAVFEEHDLAPAAIIFVRPETVPKTSSGKIQRLLCREMHRSGRIEPLARSPRRVPTPPSTQPSVPPAAGDDVRSRAAADEMRAWLRDYAPRRMNSLLMDERRSMAPHVVLDLGNKGLLGMDCPASLGGRGLRLADTLRVIEQLGAIDLSLANFVTLHNSLGLRPLIASAGDALRDRVVPAAAAGRELIAFAVTEPGAGSNPRAMTSLARRASSPDGGWLLSGDKIWIGSAGWARHINLFAVAHGEADTMLGITGFCVEADAPGLILGEEHLTMGLRSMVQNSVHLDSVRVGEDTLLGRVGRGIDVAQDAMTRTRLYIAAGAIGGIKAAAALMERYASARIVAAGPLLHLPESKRKLLSAVADAEALTELVDRATPLAEAADAGRAEIFAIAKVAGTERLWAVLDDAVQLLGGRGYIETNLLPQMVRDARVLRIFEGPSETLLDFIGAAARARGAIAEFIANALGDRESAALLAATAVRGGRVPGADLELGRIATDAAMLAAGRAASSACTEILEWRLATSRARFEDVLRRSETGLAAMAAADVAAAVRACAGDIALPPVHPPGEARRIDPLLAVPEKAAEPVGTALSAPHGPPAVDGAAMTRLIADWLAGAGLTPSADRDLSFADLGMDSLRAVELTHHLEQELALELDETILWSYPTIAKLAAYLEHRRTVAPRPRQAQPAPDAAAETIAEGCW